MEFDLLIYSALAGFLSILAPCVLPLLPVILGSAVTEKKKSTIATIIISLGISIFAFGLLLRASTLLIDVPDTFWKVFSGVIILILGIVFLFPDLWDKISFKLGLNSKSNSFLEKASSKGGFIGNVLTGFALGPVFLSCSPTYALILAIILDGGFVEGTIYLSVYTIAFSLAMFAISLYGYTVVNKLKWATDPKGKFKKVVAIIFILVGVAIIFGFDKKIETELLELTAGTPFDVTQIEREFFNQ
ncbi:MAG: cytochrome c biogenesis protein CcdA [Candidatus Dojkabacteria bacterium]|nr:cytochrome c biogenesis protein CcdA [Candidatus Dojkabacteria bacterium]MDQ7020749.1 cytochrome c biogenesis protein CcdA [Candidatus Dojkabacteria bacterium]